MSINDKHVAVVGGGPGGLTAAMILAHRGLRVTVFEAENRVGGRNAAIKLGPYTFDTGPTFLMLKRVLDEVFQEAGSSTDKMLDLRRLDPMYRLKFGDMHIDSANDRERMMEEIKRCFPGKEKNYDKFFEREEARFRRLFPCLQKSYHRFSTLFHPDLIKAIPHLAMGRSLFDVMYRCFGNEQLALSFTFQAKYLGMSPWECPGLFSIIPYIEHGFGIYHPIGGLSRISDAMAENAEKHGAEMRLSTPVKKIITRGGAAKGVVLEDGEKIECDDVIINADFGWAALNLFEPGVLRKYTPAKLKKMKVSCSTFMLYLGVDTVYDIPHHMVVFADDYRENVEAIFGGRKTPEDMSFYIRNDVQTDKTTAPEGHSSLYVLAPVSNLRGEHKWDEDGEKMRSVLLEAMEKKAGLKDLRKHIREERVITPENWGADYRVFEGATFNLSHNLRQMIYFRPRNRFEELEHCYLAGGGTHPGSGLPTIYESGRIAANLICRSYGIRFISGNLSV